MAPGGSGATSPSVPTPSEHLNQTRQAAAPGFLPIDYPPHAAAPSQSGQPASPTNQPTGTQYPQTKTDFSQQRTGGAPGDHPHNAPPLAAIPGSQGTPYTSVYENPQPDLQQLLKQTVAEALRENMATAALSTAASPHNDSTRPPNASGSDTLNINDQHDETSPDARVRSSAFNVNDSPRVTEPPVSASESVAAVEVSSASVPEPSPTENSTPDTGPAAGNDKPDSAIDDGVVQASHSITTDGTEKTKSVAKVAKTPKGKWRDEAISALADLERELATNNYTSAQRARLSANARLLHAILNDSEKALAPIKEVDEDEREYWKHLTHGLMYSLDADGKNTSTRRSALALRSLRTATDYLANISTLDIRNLTFCSKVESYGRFDEFKSTGFKSGQEVLLYVEVENFTVDSQADRHETELQGEYTIFDTDGQRVANAVLPLDKQVSKNRRHDYFIAYRMFMPKKIEQGHYTLQLTMEDVKGSKSNQATVEFWIR